MFAHGKPETVQLEFTRKGKLSLRHIQNELTCNANCVTILMKERDCYGKDCDFESSREPNREAEG